MKIGILIPNFLSWGPQRLIIDQIRHWPDQNDRFIVVTLYSQWDDNLKQELDNLGVDITSADYDGSVFSYRELKRLRNLLKSFDLDLLHTHLFHANITGRIASLGLRHKIVSTYHNTDFAQSIGSRSEMCFRFLAEFFTVRLFSTALISVSKTVAHEYRHVIGRKPSIVVYNGIDTAFLNDIKKNSNEDEIVKFLKGYKLLLMVGRLHEQKDPHLAIKAVSRLKMFGQPFKLMIIGKGPLYFSLQSQVNELGLDEEVIFLGGNLLKEDVAKWYARADALLLSSRMEGFAIVAAEAMFMGLPVICSDLPVLREVLSDDCGVFVNSRAPEEWARKIDNLLCDQTRINVIKILAPKRAMQMFGIQNNVKRLYEFYQKLHCGEVKN